MSGRLVKLIQVSLIVPLAAAIGFFAALALLPLFVMLAVSSFVLLPYVMVEAAVGQVCGRPLRRWEPAGDARVRPDHARGSIGQQGAIMGKPKDEDESGDELLGCATCRKRAADLLELRADGIRIVSLGPAYCQECGERYKAFAEAAADE